MSESDPTNWLCEKAQGFSDLPDKEREAIMHFTFLWSFFEAKALDTSASAHKILALTHKWASNGWLEEIAPFEPGLTHCRDRYFQNGVATGHFKDLNWRRWDCQELVAAVISGENTDPADSVAALLIVVLRLRNNLFHGGKWADGLSGQLTNFENANKALMAALEIELSEHSATARPSYGGR